MSSKKERDLNLNHSNNRIKKDSTLQIQQKSLYLKDQRLLADTKII
jgi:hypothetical protein